MTYRQDKCKCGNMKNIRSKTCRKCFTKNKRGQLTRKKDNLNEVLNLTCIFIIATLLGNLWYDIALFGSAI